MLASGIAEITDHDDIAVCIVEPDAAVVAIVTPDDVSADRHRAVRDVRRRHHRTLGAHRQAGHRDVHPGPGCPRSDRERVGRVLPTAVITSAESDLAFARGAGLAAALAVNTAAAPAKTVHLTKVGALSSIVGGRPGGTRRRDLGRHRAAPRIPGRYPKPRTPRASRNRLPRPARPPKPVQKPVEKPVGKPAPAAPPHTPAAPPPVQAVEAADPPAHQPPAQVAPALPPGADGPRPPTFRPRRHHPPAPVYAPPPYVPPPVTYPRPRLRDRIIERIPIINRFH